MITLKTLPWATAQEVFNQVKEHLLSQNCRSEDEFGGCSYRGENGLKCAAGCLIADDEYNPKWEGRSWQADIFPDEHKMLITELQDIHDNIDPEIWRVSLTELAKEHNLEP